LKKLFSILILGCLVIYIGGYHLVYSLHQKSIKQEIRAYFKTHTDTINGTYLSFQLADGRITDPSFGWEDGDREFRYRGELYDVVTVQHFRDSIRICAFKDAREIHLEKQLAAIHRTSHKNPQDSHVSVIKFSTFYKTDIEISFFFPQVTQQYISFCDENFLPVDPEVSTPPPRC